MLTHVTLGSNCLERSSGFYSEVLALLGYKPVMQSAAAWVWAAPGGPRFVLLKPRDGQPATVGNGATLGFIAPDRQAVDRFHARALELGGSDAGAPGIREAVSSYAAYVRDLDGHKILCSCPLQET
ncbi:VOC family protein [Pseudomonas lopnurensis]|uniref:VOC family protein n=1 Tax=Pseudomonas lopnurensis TaxID=1477517 RepID=UPI0028ADACBE|nr:VOC family protein [Pseudomonas lopnurensis]